MRQLTQRRTMRRLIIPLLIFGAVAIGAEPVRAQPTSPDALAFSSSDIKLPGGAIVHSSPTLADLTGDGIPEVIVGTTAQNPAAGNSPNRPIYLVALRGNDSILWSVQVDAPINSSPAVGDINGDGQPEVVITTGGDVGDRKRQGGLLVFDRFGNQRWRFTTIDDVPKDGFPDGAFSSPALCDVDGNGTLEIAFGGWDRQIYLFNHDGSPRWNNLNLWPGMSARAGYHNADSVWSSAACADLNGDGEHEIIIGADITGGGILPDGTRTQDGGYLYVFNKDGTPLVRRFLDEAIFSSPAVADVDDDGKLEIVVGTSYYWWQAKGSTKTNYVYVFRTDNVFGALPYADPAKLPDAQGWPQVTPFPGFSSPAVGDLDGDGKLEIVIGASHPTLVNDNLPGSAMVHAWHHNGAPVTGWPVTPKNDQGKDAHTFGSPVIADLDGDGELEVLFASVWDIHVYGANGVKKALLKTMLTVASTPAVGDTNGDGRADVYIGSSNALGDMSFGYLWHHRATSGQLGDTPWPTFRRSPTLDGHLVMVAPPAVDLLTSNVAVMADIDDPTQMQTVEGTIGLENTGGSPLDWSAEHLSAAAADDNITITPSSGQIQPDATAAILVRIRTSGLAPGAHDMGTIRIDVSSDQEALPSLDVPVSVRVSEVDYVYLPLARR